MWGISLWLWFPFPWWLMMFSTFSCTCWQSVCLWENIYLGLLHLFELDYLFFWYWVVWVPYIFWILIFYQICVLKCFFPIPNIVFSYWSFLLLCRSFFVWCSTVCLFFAFVAYVLGVISIKTLQRQMSRRFSPFASRNFKSLIYFELIFASGVRLGSSFILFHVNIQFSQHYLWNRLSFLH